MSVRVAINGLGRTGRSFLRSAYARQADIEVVAVNDLADAETLAYLLKYDSVGGRFPADVRADQKAIVIDERPIRALAETDPAQLPWGDLDVDVVIESTGHFRTRPAAARHLEAGARKVIISAPATNEDITVCLGVNHLAYNPAEHDVISNASCTTNCLAPVAKVLSDSFGIEAGLMTTIHAYTNDMVLLDTPHKDLRRARAAGLSIIPTSTGAAKAMSLVMPELKGKLHGMSLRVPVSDVSLVDLSVTLNRDVTAEDVNAAFREAADGSLNGILAVSDEPLVSIDYLHDSHSSIVDAPSTMVIGERTVKVLSWYDNEWGYSCRCVELAEHIAGRL
jgi:glyceraldehyde 3-phosphate dehydrogenase